MKDKEKRLRRNIYEALVGVSGYVEAWVVAEAINAEVGRNHKTTAGRVGHMLNILAREGAVAVNTVPRTGRPCYILTEKGVNRLSAAVYAERTELKGRLAEVEVMREKVLKAKRRLRNVDIVNIDIHTGDAVVAVADEVVG